MLPVMARQQKKIVGLEKEVSMLKKELSKVQEMLRATM
jgi:hypothetical protein